MIKLLSKYRNGNYMVKLYSNGTKIRFNRENHFDAEFAESMDMKITNYCPYNCPMCHEKSSTDGKYALVMDNSFIDSLKEGTELAIGGGAVTSHPQLIPFLKKLKEKKIFPSITINQREYEEKSELINYLVEEELIYGLGVSFVSFNNELWGNLLKNQNVVVHLIAGYHSIEVFNYFKKKRAKILILGYKQWGRGEDFYSLNETSIEKNISELKENLVILMQECKVVSFDNLAIRQLDIKSLLSEEQWNEFYMGDDGQFTMYVDMVKQEFARTSTSSKRYPLIDNSVEAFQVIKNEKSDE